MRKKLPLLPDFSDSNSKTLENLTFTFLPHSPNDEGGILIIDGLEETKTKTEVETELKSESKLQNEDN